MFWRLKSMSRRAVNPNRRLVDSGSNPLVGSLHQKSRSSPLLSVGLVLLVGFTFWSVQYFWCVIYRFGSLFGNLLVENFRVRFFWLVTPIMAQVGTKSFHIQIFGVQFHYFNSKTWFKSILKWFFLCCILMLRWLRWW